MTKELTEFTYKTIKTMKKIIYLALIAIFVGVFSTGCEKESVLKQNETENNAISTKNIISREDYSWIHEAILNSTIAYLNTLDSSEYVNYDFLGEILKKSLWENGVQSPKNIEDIQNMSSDVFEFCEEIAKYPKNPSEKYICFVESLLKDVLTSNMTKEEKEFVVIFAEVQYSCVDLICFLTNDQTKQPPRTSYSSQDGELRVERQMHACIDYKLDGHFETTMGKVRYFFNIPGSAIGDIIECCEEIYRGMWNHVKKVSASTPTTTSKLIKQYYESK